LEKLLIVEFFPERPGLEPDSPRTRTAKEAWWVAEDLRKKAELIVQEEACITRLIRGAYAHSLLQEAGIPIEDENGIVLNFTNKDAIDRL
jgi:hypothetical protein